MSYIPDKSWEYMKGHGLEKDVFQISEKVDLASETVKDFLIHSGRLYFLLTREFFG